jgi:PPM family protein phosphatase
MDLMMIGAFAERARLSPKALRLYDRLGLLQPVRTDPVSGYRFYSEDQVADARLIALLRRLGMPLRPAAMTISPPSATACRCALTSTSLTERSAATRLRGRPTAGAPGRGG